MTIKGKQRLNRELSCFVTTAQEPGDMLWELLPGSLMALLSSAPSLGLVELPECLSILFSTQSWFPRSSAGVKRAVLSFLTVARLS